ncbi:MAG: putative sugar nucleotidyl transferase [Ginsengibacter sp.]
MDIFLDDIPYNHLLYPFASVRSMAHLRVGILTIFEKWQYIFPGKVYITSEHSKNTRSEKDILKVSANVLPSVDYLLRLKADSSEVNNIGDCKVLQNPWQLFGFNDWAIREDFRLITAGRSSTKISDHNQLIYPENIFIEEGAKIDYSIINASDGPVYIGKNAEVWEGCLVRGPFALCEGSKLKMGTKIYGATTLGPNCIGGGEIKNSVMMGYSNKAHDGYLGDSVIGEWCNLGAGTSNSNLKNTAGIIRVWNNSEGAFMDAGTKCGLLMGDYSRSAINTSFNTGSVVGVCCNIFGNSFPSKYIEDFSWGNQSYIFEKAIQDISNWKKLKSEELTQDEIDSLKILYALKHK